MPIKKLIFNPVYALTSLYKDVLPDEDVVIVVSKVNLFNKGFNSICLPRYYESSPLDVFYQEGHYNGIGGILKVDDPTPETRSVRGVLLRGSDRHTAYTTPQA